MKYFVLLKTADTQYLSLPPSQASIILLYDVMIVNNWQAFMDAYSRYTTE